MMGNHIGSYYLLFAMFLLVEMNPICKFYGERETDVVCSPGDSDYILKRGLVSDRNKTTGVTLRGCRISEVDFEAFENLFNLKYIDLSHNNISALKLGVLDGTPQVTYLNLSYNLLSEFPLGLFDQLPNLEVMDLKGNRIGDLELGVFDPLKKLRHLDLSSNQLEGKSINLYLFDETPHITFIDFSRNNMNDAPDNILQSFQALELLNLDKCLLNKVPRFATSRNLKTIKHLILSSNNISSLENDTFLNLDSIEILDLSYNKLEYLHRDVFKPMKRIKIIQLRQNIIQHIPDDLFLNMKSIGNIDLSHNLIASVPVNAFRGTSLKNLNLSDNRFTYLQDNFCLELKNSGVHLKKFYFNQNPWQCACLVPLLNEVKKYNIGYNSVHYDGKHPICVTTEDAICNSHDSFNSIYTELYDQIVAMS